MEEKINGEYFETEPGAAAFNYNNVVIIIYTFTSIQIENLIDNCLTCPLHSWIGLIKSQFILA